MTVWTRKTLTALMLAALALLLSTIIVTPVAAHEELPTIVEVVAGEHKGKDGEFVTFDNGVTTHVPRTLGRTTSGNSAPPALGKTQAYEDTRLCLPVVGCGFGYVHFTDSQGRSYSGT
jgi:hypothetical protein